MLGKYRIVYTVSSIFPYYFIKAILNLEFGKSSQVWLWTNALYSTKEIQRPATFTSFPLTIVHHLDLFFSKRHKFTERKSNPKMGDSRVHLTEAITVSPEIV